MFKALYQSANFDPDEQIFYPSRIRIVFKPIEEDDDSRLLTSLQRKTNITFEEATEILQEFVSTTLSRLNRNHYCKLEGIGYLINDPNMKPILVDTFGKKQKNTTLATY